MLLLQEGFDLVQRNLEAGAMRGFDVGVEVLEQRFDGAPNDNGPFSYSERPVLFLG
jgi:hypothetical protein